MTPMVKSGGLERKLGLTSLSFKLEYSNPTGSFKDRGTIPMVDCASAGITFDALGESLPLVGCLVLYRGSSQHGCSNRESS